MNEIQALLLGILQGLTEFLPVSSSGHLEIGHALLGVKTSNNLLFAVVVHLATVLSTIVVFRKNIWSLLKGLLEFKWNDSAIYVSKLIFSAIPVAFAGFFLSRKLNSSLQETLSLQAACC